MWLLIVFFKLSKQKIFVFYPILPSMNIAKIGIFLKKAPKKKKNFQLFLQDVKYSQTISYELLKFFLHHITRKKCFCMALKMEENKDNSVFFLLKNRIFAPVSR